MTVEQPTSLIADQVEQPVGMPERLAAQIRDGFLL